MNILFIKHYCVGFMVSDTEIVAIYSGTVRIRLLFPSLYFYMYI